ncbi:TetR/AcrR family transcriptional regulator [Tardiphaga alba]|uniref:TetR/AcrR family transcriptional regulator n=1 Tax=Tardiphaga alba TaxID=340268 RepID=A0ABX8A8M9_9BRAD|nr:TetR/AcrR family transcriptional regulator [Tardiphaga alba]QUS40018.1 TetR/AcrR family transcriptional regulator [Tardiphaga alba]
MDTPTTRVSILEVSAELYADLGYSAVSMRDIAKKVGVTPANLYHHFKGKDDLIREALAHVFAEKTAPIAALLNEKHDEAERLGIFIAYFVKLLAEDRVFFRLLVRELVDGDENRLGYLARSVLERPFRLISSLAGPGQSEDQQFLATVSIVSLVLGHALLAPLLPHLPGGRPDHSDASVVIGHVTAALSRAFHSNGNDK